MTRLDRAAIDKDGRNVEPRDRDHRAGHVLVAAADRQQAVHPLRAARRLDRIGDHFPRDQRVPHPFGAHRDAVADGDRSECLRHRAALAQCRHGAVREPVQPCIARRDGAVGARHSDNGLGEVAVLEPHGAQHRAIGSTCQAFRHGATAKIVAHASPSRASLKTYSTIRSPISTVPTVASPGSAISRVRAPASSAAPMASSTALAGSASLRP